MSALVAAINEAIRRRDLTPDAMRAAVEVIMDGQATNAQIGAFLAALRTKGETPAEIAAAAHALRCRAHRIAPQHKVLDTCGTGGDASGSFNVSTTVAFVVAAAGVSVAKHGNRAVSSSTGSADVLEALGCRVDLTPDQVLACIDAIGIGFLFAPTFNAAMRHAAQARKEIGFRSLFNLLGPLCNPAGPAFQVLGVYDPSLTPALAQALGDLGAERAAVVSGEDGFDELSLAGPSRMSEFVHGRVTTRTITPEDTGLARAPVEALRGGDARTNAGIIEAVLTGTETGPKRDVVLLNAAAALQVAGRAPTLSDGVRLAREAITSGAAHAKLEALRKRC